MHELDIGQHLLCKAVIRVGIVWLEVQWKETWNQSIFQLSIAFSTAEDLCARFYTNATRAFVNAFIELGGIHERHFIVVVFPFTNDSLVLGYLERLYATWLFCEFYGEKSIWTLNESTENRPRRVRGGGKNVIISITEHHIYHAFKRR